MTKHMVMISTDLHPWMRTYEMSYMYTVWYSWGSILLTKSSITAVNDRGAVSIKNEIVTSPGHACPHILEIYHLIRDEIR